MMPSAPGRLSITIGRPQRSASRSASTRAARSMEPPGALGVSTRTTRSGQVPAQAKSIAERTFVARRHATRATKCRRVIFLPPLPDQCSSPTRRTPAVLHGGRRTGRGFHGKSSLLPARPNGNVRVDVVLCKSIGFITIMNYFDLRRIDLNLLVTFDALMTERSVTRAAERLGLGQPAVSHALGRLRELLGDPLFVVTRHGLTPTRRALGLATWVRSVLEQAQRALLEPASFKPAEWTETVRIAMTPTVDMVLMPRLL